jgi:hypothetical protein
MRSPRRRPRPERPTTSAPMARGDPSRTGRCRGRSPRGKNANASSANGNPITLPHRPISLGQKRPSENDRTVPLTAPTANRIPNPIAQRLASASQTASPVRFARYSAYRSRTGSPTPRHAKTMWNPRETAIWVRPASRFVMASIGATTRCSHVSGSPAAALPGRGLVRGRPRSHHPFGRRALDRST